VPEREVSGRFTFPTLTPKAPSTAWFCRERSQPAIDTELSGALGRVDLLDLVLQQAHQFGIPLVVDHPIELVAVISG
jgi:hypothetical protein